MDQAKEGDLAYLENEIEVRWFLEHVPEAVRDALKELNVRISSTGRILAPLKVGCPFGNIGPCASRDRLADPPPFSDILQTGPIRTPPDR